MDRRNREAAKVTVAAANLQALVATAVALTDGDDCITHGNASDILNACAQVAYALGDVIEETHRRRFAGLDLAKAVELVAKSPEGAEVSVQEVRL